MKFAERLRSLFGSKRIDEEFYEELEDALVESDIGPLAASSLIASLKESVRKKGAKDEEAVKAELKAIVAAALLPYSPHRPGEGLSVYILLGVNGVGKTTTVAKLAARLAASEGKVVIAAADTFRAAATDQLAIHGERLGVRVVSQGQGADPGAVIFDAIDAAAKEGASVLLVDTAGRLHNKQNLVRELEKITKIICAKASPERIRKFLVLDATTGRNGLRQAEVFNEAVGVDAIILTKMDSTAKGGVAIASAREYGIPTAYVCYGEGYDHIKPFDPAEFAEGFVGP